MNVLGKLFNKKKTYPKDSKFEVLIIGEDRTDFQEMLGITDERREELMKLAFNSYKTEDLYSSACKEAVAGCKQINEVVFTISMMAKLKEMANNPLSAILSGINHGE
jgi:hypothetical protein